MKMGGIERYTCVSEILHEQNFKKINKMATCTSPEVFVERKESRTERVVY